MTTLANVSEKTALMVVVVIVFFFVLPHLTKQGFVLSCCK